jgi:hypothetical protein
LRDVTYVASLTAREPLEKGRYFAGLAKLRTWLDSDDAPFAGYRRLYDLYTLKGAASFREHPDLLVRFRRSLYPLYAWLRVELAPDLKIVQLRTGMASHTGADAGWGRILWAAVGRAFIYVIPVWLVLYLVKPWEFNLPLGTACLVVAGLGFLLFEFTLVRAALVARSPGFRAELSQLHEKATGRVAGELGLSLLTSRQVAGPGVEPEIPRRHTVTGGWKNFGGMPPPKD